MKAVLHILLPVHNRIAKTAPFADALTHQTLKDFQLHLLDDGSTDGSADAVRASLGDRVSVHRGRGDWWWAGALQAGFEALRRSGIAAGDPVLIINDDVEIGPDFLATGVALLDQHPQSMVIARTGDGRGPVSETCFIVDYRRTRVDLAPKSGPANAAPTRGLFIRWADMERVGGFRPSVLPHYLSDIEWTHRAWKMGIAIVRDDRLTLVKDERATGVPSAGGGRLIDRIRMVGSRKNMSNPFAWSAFVLLSFPVRHMPMSLFRVAKSGLAQVLGLRRGER